MIACKPASLSTGEQLSQAREMNRGVIRFAGSVAAPALRNPFELLSARERQIANLVASGSSNKEIARALFISPCTVSSHLRQIFAKLGLTRRMELCMLWYRAEGLGRESG